MRQIRFRGRSLRTGEWLYGDLLRNENGAVAVVPPFKLNKHNECSYYEVDADTVGQFIGVTDKNGKEIYGGDLVRYYDDIEDELVTRPVEYLDDYCAFCAVHPKRDPDGIFAQWEYEVVGNIHDKKESDGED